MKKIVIAFLIMICILSMFISYKIYATNGRNVLESDTTVKLVEIKEKSLKELDDYVEAYGDDTYGLTAYILNKIRFISIPLCFLGISISAIFQYALGIRNMGTRYKGFFAMIAFVTILIVCQVLPFIFVVVVKFGRS